MSNVFELFIFSDVFEINRNILVEGNSLMLTLIKNFIDENKIQKRINVKKIVALKEVINQTYKNIVFKFKNLNELNILNKLSTEKGETDVVIHLDKADETLILKLKNKRKIDNKLINSLNLVENVLID